MRTIFTTIFIFSLYLFSSAQEATLQGTVKDVDGLELFGVTIKNIDGEGVVTGFEGEYELKLPAGKHELTFSYIGFGDQIQQVELAENETKQLDIVMSEEAEQLQIIVVSSSQYKKNLAEETVSMEVIPASLLKDNNNRDLGDALNRVPGVQMTDGQVVIRGGSGYSFGIGSRTAVLVDDMPYMAADLGEAHLKFVPMEDAQQIEVIKGSSSVVYGSSALNGVVNFRTAWPMGTKPETQMSSFVQLYQDVDSVDTKWRGTKRPSAIGYTLSHRQRIGRLQLIAGAFVESFNSYLESNDQFRIRGNFKTRYTPKGHDGISFGLNASFMRENWQRFFMASNLDSMAYNIYNGSQDKYNYVMLRPHFNFVNKKGDQFKMQVQFLRRQKIDYLTDETNAADNSFSTNPQYQKNINDRFIVTVGTPALLSYSYSNYYPGSRKTYNVAGYTQAEYKNKWFSLVSGVRLEMSGIDTIYSTTLPVFRTGMNFKTGRATWLRCSWGQSYRLPSVFERYVAQEFISGVFMVPNRDLKPEKGWSAELGLKQGISFLGFRGFLDLAFFSQRFSDFVEYKYNFYDNKDDDGNILFPSQGNKVLGMKPFNVEQAAILGSEASVMGKGKFGPVEMNAVVGYTYNYPGNLDTDTTQRNARVFMNNALQHFTGRISEEEDLNKLLALRSRHLFRSDIGLKYKKYSLGFNAVYNSYPELIPAYLYIAIATIDQGMNSLVDYAEAHKKGDLLLGGRVGYQASEAFYVGVIGNNLLNHSYGQRPGKLEAPRSVTVQMRWTM